MKRFIVILSSIALLFVGFMFGSVRGREIVEQEYAARVTPTPIEFPTGYQVLEELDEYRVSQGLPEFELSKVLCNNIASRWDNYVENDSHQGFSDFLDEYMPYGLEVSEILAPGNTAEETVQNWISSPGHEIAIRGYSKICVYSAQGLSVALLSN